MTWRRYLEMNTRQPEFLWRMVIGILLLGVGLGFLAQQVYQPTLQGVVEQEEKTDPSEPSASDRLEELAEQGEWAKVWWGVPQAFYYGYKHTGPFILAIITGICWLAFLLQAMRVSSPRDASLWCALFAVALGVLSIWPTGFFIFWQEFDWGLQESNELIPGLRYYVLGVGLREEFAKLCCLLPLMLLLLRWRSELLALLLSGCVGLGFAVEENASYFSGSLGTNSLGRFLMANPLHIALTGLIGLALYRALRNPSGWGSHSLGMFGAMIIAHGLYDAFIGVSVLNKEFSIVTPIIFALVMYQFFRELRDLRPKDKDTISLSANFLFGVSVLTSATFIYLSATFGTLIAFDTLVNGVLGLAVMVYLFLREMPETMVTV